MLPEINLRTELARIRARGYIPAKRKGDSSVGDTLEAELGLVPTSKAGVADLLYNGIPTELKARRKRSKAKTSLFACRPQAQVLSTRELVRTYGRPTQEHVKALFCEVSVDGGNSAGFQLRVESASGRLYLLGPAGETLWIWEEENLATKIVKQLVIVEAESLGTRENESFLYESATLYSNLRPGAFFELVKAGSVVVHIRARFRANMADWKNHGTVFRSDRTQALASCYAHQEKLL